MSGKSKNRPRGRRSDKGNSGKGKNKKNDGKDEKSETDSSTTSGSQPSTSGSQKPVPERQPAQSSSDPSKSCKSTLPPLPSDQPSAQKTVPAVSSETIKTRVSPQQSQPVVESTVTDSSCKNNESPEKSVSPPQLTAPKTINWASIVKGGSGAKQVVEKAETKQEPHLSSPKMPLEGAGHQESAPQRLLRDSGHRGRQAGGPVLQSEVKTPPTEKSQKTKPPEATPVMSKHGVSGEKVKLTANYYELTKVTEWTVYMYNVEFDPKEERTDVKKDLLYSQNKALVIYLFDGGVLFVPYPLEKDPTVLFAKRESDQKIIRMTLTRVGVMEKGNYQFLQFFNILLRKCLCELDLQLVGRNYYDPDNKAFLECHKLELWPGYITSISQYESNVMLCVEINHKVMRTETALHLLNECKRRNPRDWQKIFIEAITSSIVLTTYNNFTYQIDDVDFNTSPSSSFKRADGNMVTFADYHQLKYGLRVKDLHQPMLVSKPKAKDYRAGRKDLIKLIPEFCRLTGIDNEMRTNMQLMKAVSNITRMAPKDRMQELTKFRNRLQSKKKVTDQLRVWNLNLSPSLVEFNGRILNQETIHFAVRGAKPSEPGDWEKLMQQEKINGKFNLTNWSAVYVNNSSEDSKAFIDKLIYVAKRMGFNLPAPHLKPLPDDKKETYILAVENLVAHRNPEIIVFIVPNKKADRYAAIKKKCCIDRPVPTQVVLQKTIKSNQRFHLAIAQKIVIQINCKLGGYPWGVEIPLQHLMVVGYDAYHDRTSKSKSFGAVVASLNATFSSYFSSTTQHSAGEELSDHLPHKMKRALERYYKLNGCFPHFIVIYRDGVGEGMIQYVKGQELKKVQEVLMKMYGGKMPKLAFIIVTKRLMTRLFLNQKNPPPGTVVDDCITNPERYDFYLVSQSVRQGTVSPTAYNVIFDNTGMTAERMQRLTYKFTHLYYNWTGTIRVPAPCQYAHRLAYLVGGHLKKPPNDNFTDVLYYL